MEVTGAKAAAVLAETTNAAKTFMVMMCVVVVVAVVGATVVDVATMAQEQVRSKVEAQDRQFDG